MSDEDRTALRLLQLQLSHHVGEIKRLFPPGVVVTVVVRNPDERTPGACDVVIGDDNLADAAVAIARAIGGGQRCFPGQCDEWRADGSSSPATGPRDPALPNGETRTSEGESSG